MRLLIRLCATADAAYDTSAHHKIRGRLWRAFSDVGDIHASNEGIGISYSNIYPWGEISEGDERSLLVASPNRDILDDLVAHLDENREFDVGTMRFEVTDVSMFAPDVGEPGTRGIIETATGVVCRLTKEHAERYGLDTSQITSGETKTRMFWRPKHGMEPLQRVIRYSLQESHDRFGDDYYDGPVEVDERLFESFDPIKDDITYAIPFTPTTGVTRTYILSKWRFGYCVRDETHRYHLNLALDSGIGQRREHGFGFINLDEEATTTAAKAVRQRDGGRPR